jgi:hypothetical protein
MTTLDAMVAQNSTSRLAVALAVWYPSADILLIAMVLLVYLTRFIPRRNLRQLSLIGAGFAATAMSDVVFSYYLAGSPEYLGGGVGTYPLVADLGYFVGPILLAWAAALKDFTPAHSAARHSPRRTVARTPTWPHLPLLLATMFLSGKAITGTNLTPTEAVGAVAIFLLITLRQGVVLAATRFNQATDAEESRTSFKTTIRQVIDRAAKEATSADVGLTDGGTSADRPTGLRPASDKYLDHRLKDDLERLLRPHIQFLSDEHRRNIESLQRSGNRMALWTFAGGVVLGLLGNVVVALLIS